MFEEVGQSGGKKKWMMIGIGGAILLIFIVVRNSARNSVAPAPASDPNATSPTPTVIDTGAYPTMDATGMNQTLSTYLAIADQNTSTQMSALNNELGTIQNQMNTQNATLQAQILAMNTNHTADSIGATNQPITTTTPETTAHPNPNSISLIHFGNYATPRGGWNPNSVVDNLKQQGARADIGARSTYANQVGITNYTGTASQNVQLLNALKAQGK